MKRPANPAGLQWATLVLLPPPGTKPKRISHAEQDRQKQDPEGYRREQAAKAEQLWKEAEAEARKRGWVDP